MNPNKIIEKYIRDVGHNLPLENREDIQRELSSILQDKMEDWTAAKGEKLTEEDVLEYLNRLGSPEDIAARYQPQKRLIGPKQLSTYKGVLSIAITVIALFHLVLLIFILAKNGTAEWGQALVNLLISFAQVALAIVGLITLVFMVLDQLDKSPAFPQSTKAWNPRQQSLTKPPKRFNRFDLIPGIVFTILLIVALNFFYGWIGFLDLAGERKGIVPLLAPEFQQQVPLLTLSLVLHTLLLVIVLIQGHWSKLTRWLHVGSQAFSVFVLYCILTGDEISIVPFFTVIAKGILLILMVIVVLQIIRMVNQLLFKRNLSQNVF